MANIKTRLKTPKSGSPKKRGRPKSKKSSTGPSKQKGVLGSESQIVRECDVVMKRPSNTVVMTPEEKVQFILTNGHKLKEKFIARQPKNGGKNREPPIYYRKKQNRELPLITKSGRVMKKTKCNLKLIDSILKNELMICDSAEANPPNLQTHPVASPPLAISPLPNGENNNNNDDDEKSDQNNTCEDISDDESDIDIISDVDNTDESDNNSEHSTGSKQQDKKTKSKSESKKPTHVTLDNGVVLKLAYFECDHCGKSFNRKASLCRHMMMHLDLKPYTCIYCPEEFRSRYNMQVHIKRYHKDAHPGLYVCTYCEETFLTKENLKIHLLVHTSKADNCYKCIYCDEVFTQNLLLMNHEKKHMVNGRHACTLCNMTYRCRNRLYLHVKSHLKIKDYICQYCGKGFLRNESMVRHFEVFHGGHRLVCPICKKNLKGHLTEHMRTHEKKRPHKCPDCGQRFTQSTQLNVHRRAHTGARPYLCQICNRFFSHSNALMLHIRRHTGEKPFPCAMCPMSFSQLPHMKTHMYKIHGKKNPYKCSSCNSFFKLKAQLDVHAKSCRAGKVKDKKKSNNAEEEVVESMMSLSRMRFLLALLFTMITTKEKLKYLGFNKRLIDEILIESLEAMEKTPCKKKTFTPIKRLKTNIEMLLIGTVPKDQMERFKNENKSTEDILELLTNEKGK